MNANINNNVTNVIDRKIRNKEYRYEINGLKMKKMVSVEDI